MSWLAFLNNPTITNQRYVSSFPGQTIINPHELACFAEEPYNNKPG